ncbi:MAG: tail fiber domain-containing protein, partial [Candidatus Omnitrophota bacterium]
FGDSSTVAGGEDNIASVGGSVVSGGINNNAASSFSLVAGGGSNVANGISSIVAGGQNNTASGLGSTVSGGADNSTAADYSWVGGRRMRLTATADNTFAWGIDLPPGSPPVIKGANRFLIFPGYGADQGRVGINMPEEPMGEILDPSVALVVNGRVRITDIPDSGGLVGPIYYNDATNILSKPVSNRKYKKNIRALKVDSNKVLKLEPVRFQWKETGKEDIGLIAEDVKEILPDLVIHYQKDKSDSVKYDKVALYLLQVVKDLKAENDSLKSRVAALEKKK